MGLKDIFKINDFKNTIVEQENTISEQKKVINEQKSLLTDEHGEVLNIKKLLFQLKTEESSLHETIQDLKNTIKQLEETKSYIKKDLIELDDEILYQSFGLYKPLYNFIELDQYKDKLNEIREKQKEMIQNKSAATCNTSWRVNNSIRSGRKMTNDNIKQILRSFNTECDVCIDKVKFNNYESIKDRITKSYEMLNKLNGSNEIEISIEYYDLKINELNLSYEYSEKKQEEKEEARRLREVQREEAKVAKEIEEKRKEIEKEQIHYKNAMKKIQEQLEKEKGEERKKVLLDKQKELELNLVDLDAALKDIDYREANQKAGYVYIISNIGAFGENVYKIGMTRRLEPEDRIDELSGASVPFMYDIHAMIFSDNAPKLEAALHNAFAKEKLNMINGRKEFFRVEIERIKEVVNINHDKTVEFLNIPVAEQFRESEMLRKKLFKDKD